MGRFFCRFNEGFDRLIDKYGRGVGLATGNLRKGLLLFLVFLVCTGALFRHLPSGFVPDEDQGYFISALSLPEASSVNRTNEVGHRVAEIIRELPGIKDTILISGVDVLSGSAKPNTAIIAVSMKPWEERREPALQVKNRIRAVITNTDKVSEGSVVAFNAPALPGLGGQGKLSMMLQNRGGASLTEMQEVAGRFITEANKIPEVGVF